MESIDDYESIHAVLNTLLMYQCPYNTSLHLDRHQYMDIARKRPLYNNNIVSSSQYVMSHANYYRNYPKGHSDDAISASLKKIYYLPFVGDRDEFANIIRVIVRASNATCRRYRRQTIFFVLLDTVVHIISFTYYNVSQRK